MKLPLGFAIGIGIGSALSGIAILFLFSQLGFLSLAGSGLAPNLVDQSGLASQLGSLTKPTMKIQVRESLGNDTFLLPAHGSRQVVFQTEPADRATLIGSMDLTGEGRALLKVTGLDGSCPQTGCPQATIYGPAEINSSPTGNAVSMLVPAGQSQALLFTNQSDQAQTIGYHFILEYEKTVPKH